MQAAIEAARDLPLDRSRAIRAESGLGARHPLFRGRRLIFPIPAKRDRQTIDHIAGLLASAAFNPVIDRRYGLDQIVEAYRYVETGQKIGNVLIDVAPLT
jgi:NADPH:quinone reductase-like Zn-dependent oxidoreductase